MKTDQLGLGYGNSTFTSLPKALSDSGIINSPAFSVWSEDSTHGSVLFGGVDKDKYTGSLNTLPVVDGKGSRKAFRVNLTNLSIDKKSVSSDSLPVNAILNTGYAFTYVPQSLAEGLFAQVKPNMANVTGKLQISIPCEQPNKTISFIFGQASFDLDLQHFVTRYAPIQNYPGPEGGCYLGIVASHNPRNEGDVVLGMNFLSRMYTVFDMENHEVSLAERNWDSSSSDVHEIGKGKKNDSSGGEGEGEGEGDGDGDDKESMGIHVELSGLWTLAGIAVVGMYMCIWT